MTGKPDLILFAGPAILRAADMAAIPWTNPTVCKMISGTGSDTFQAIAGSMRDGQGRILPNLVKTYAGGTLDDWGGIALASFSAGWGLLNEVAKIPADVDRIVGMTAHDSAFGGSLQGYRSLADRAASRADKVLVFTNTNNSANAAMGILRTGRETVQEVMLGAQTDTGIPLQQLSPRPPMPTPSGGVWGAGSLVWYDYVKPGSPANTGNDLTHEEHNYLAPKVWEAYLVPAFAGSIPGTGPKLLDTIGMALLAVSVLAGLYLWSQRK